MRAFGFTPEDYEDEAVEVWPENWPAFKLFSDVRTQWRVSYGGPIGLDYGVIYREMDLLELSKEEQLEWMDDIRAMEDAAMAEMQNR